MFKLMVIFAVLIVDSYGSSGRIVNGTDAEEGEFPFAVSLRRNNRHTCGATILNEKFILTAAHCVCSNNKPLDHKDYSIQYGLVEITKEPINTIPVSKIYCNDFNNEELIKDSAVLELKSGLPEGEKIWKRVKLARNFDTSEPQKGTIIGWGKISADGPLATHLQKLAVDIFDDNVCSTSEAISYDVSNHICFGVENAGACNGDSGTALLVQGVQVGIASFITAKCGTANKEHPNVYSRVPSYFKWIKKIAGYVEE